MQDEDLFWEQTEKAKNLSPDDPELLDMSRRSFMQRIGLGSPEVRLRLYAITTFMAPACRATRLMPV